MTAGHVIDHITEPITTSDLIEALHTHPGRCDVCDRSAHVHEDGVCARCRRAGARFAAAWARDLVVTGTGVDELGEILGIESEQ
jgi:hypothetical protein